MVGDGAGGGGGGDSGWLGVGWWEGVMNDIVDLGHMMVAAITSGGSIDKWKPPGYDASVNVYRTAIPRRLRW